MTIADVVREAQSYLESHGFEYYLFGEGPKTLHLELDGPSIESTQDGNGASVNYCAGIVYRFSYGARRAGQIGTSAVRLVSDLVGIIKPLCDQSGYLMSGGQGRDGIWNGVSSELIIIAHNITPEQAETEMDALLAYLGRDNFVMHSKTTYEPVAQKAIAASA